MLLVVKDTLTKVQLLTLSLELDSFSPHRAHVPRRHKCQQC